MAFNVSYIFLAQDKFTAVNKKIQQATAATRKRFKGLGAQADATRRKLDRLRTSTTKFKKAATGLGSTLGSVLGAVTLIKVKDQVSGFEDALADLSAITGAVGKDLRFLSDASFDLGKTAAVSGTKVLTAFKLVASAKPELLKNLPALKAVTEQVLLLANAAGLELPIAATIVAQSLNQFGQGADQAARFVNVLAAGAKFGASEIGETGEALLKTGATARAAGLSFEKVNALIQALASGGIKAAIAGTGLNAVIAKSQKLGIDFSKIGLADAFVLIKNAVNSYKDVQSRTNFIVKAFGLENLKTIETLIAQTDAISDFERKLTGTNTAQEQAIKRLATFSAKMRIAGTIIESVVVNQFGPLLDKLGDLAIKFGVFAEANPRLIEFGLAMGLILATVVALGLPLAILAGIIPTIAAGFSVIGAGIAFALGPAALLVGTLVAGAALIIANWRPLVAFFSGFWQGLVEGVAPIREAFAPILEFVFDMVSGIGSFLGALFTIESKLSDINNIGRLVGEVIGSIIALPASVTNFIGEKLGFGEGSSDISAPTTETLRSQSVVDVNFNAPEGVVQSIKTKTTGAPGAMALGVNMDTS